jgi:hypothetical protein
VECTERCAFECSAAEGLLERKGKVEDVKVRNGNRDDHQHTPYKSSYHVVVKVVLSSFSMF